MKLRPIDLAQTRKAWLRMQVIMERRFDEEGCDNWLPQIAYGMVAVASILMSIGMILYFTQ